MNKFATSQSVASVLEKTNEVHQRTTEQQEYKNFLEHYAKMLWVMEEFGRIYFTLRCRWRGIFQNSIRLLDRSDISASPMISYHSEACCEGYGSKWISLTYVSKLSSNGLGYELPTGQKSSVDVWFHKASFRWLNFFSCVMNGILLAYKSGVLEWVPSLRRMFCQRIDFKSRMKLLLLPTPVCESSIISRMSVQSRHTRSSQRIRGKFHMSSLSSYSQESDSEEYLLQIQNRRLVCLEGCCCVLLFALESHQWTLVNLAMNRMHLP